MALPWSLPPSLVAHTVSHVSCSVSSLHRLGFTSLVAHTVSASRLVVQALVLGSQSEALEEELRRLQIAETGGLAIGQLQLLHETTKGVLQEEVRTAEDACHVAQRRHADAASRLRKRDDDLVLLIQVSNLPISHISPHLRISLRIPLPIPLPIPLAISPQSFLNLSFSSLLSHDVLSTLPPSPL